MQIHKCANTLQIRSEYGTYMSWGDIYVERSPFRGKNHGKIRINTGNLIKINLANTLAGLPQIFFADHGNPNVRAATGSEATTRRSGQNATK